jgi:hypothetical protein
MSSFTKLLSRLTSLNEAKDSPMDRIMPGFQSQARSLAKSRGASSGTREGRLAMLGILFDLDIIDDAVVRMFKNDPSVSRMVEYFESNGIASKIKAKRDEIQSHIKDQLENKVSFTTGNRTDAAQQRYEVNKLNAELTAAKKVARLERKKETASAMSSMRQTVDMYDDLVGSLEQSYSNEYMLEIVADRDTDLSDINSMVRYLSRFVDESDIEVEGKSIDVVFSPSSKLGKIINKMGVEKIERQIADDLRPYGGAGIVIHEPDSEKKEATGSLKAASSIEDEEYEDEEMNKVGDEDAESESSNFTGLAEDYSNVEIDPEVQDAQKKALKELQGQPVTEGTSIYLEKVDFKRLGRGALAAGALTAATVGGVNALQKAAKPIGDTITGEVSNIVTRGGNKDFLAKISDEEDRKKIIAELENLRGAGVSAELSGKSDQYLRVDSNLRKLEDEMRLKYDIPNNVHLHENVDAGTGAYLVEQAAKDSVTRSSQQQGISFKEKYKPKTSYQLEELRRYGL